MAAPLPPAITGDISQLDPATIAEDKATLQAVQEQYGRLRQLALDTQQQQILGATLDKLGTQLTTQAISASQQISFSGKPKDLLYFLSDVEKHVFLATGGQDDRDLRRAVYQFSKGAVSDYIRSLVEGNNNIAWADVKTRLNERFGERVDPQTLLIRLRNYSQRPGQSIAVFAELLHYKAQQIYGADVGTQFAQRELVSIFSKGLKNKAVAKKVLIEHPNNFSQAVESAITQEEKEARLAAHGLGSAPSTSQRHEPMDVDAVHKRRGHKPGYHKASSQKNLEHKTRDKSEKRENSQRLCFGCNKPGHFIAQCPAKQKPLN